MSKYSQSQDVYIGLMAKRNETADPTLSIDELAREVDLPSSTIRMYQSRKLLPPPTKVGRGAVYGSVHLNRLQLIASLQTRGFSLAAISGLIEAWEQGEDLESLVGSEATLARILHTPEPLRMPLAEAVRRVGAPSDLAAMQPIIEAGVLTLEADEHGDVIVVVPNPVLLEAGEVLHSIGVTPEERVAEFVYTRQHVTEVVDRFVDLFDLHLPEAAANFASGDAEVSKETAEVFSRLVTAGERMLVSMYREEVRTRAMDRIGGTPPGGPNAVTQVAATLNR